MQPSVDIAAGGAPAGAAPATGSGQDTRAEVEQAHFDAALTEAGQGAAGTGGPGTPEPPASSGWSFSDIGHTVLDVAGMVPVIGEVADGINAVWYAGEGRWVDAGLSAAGMIPMVGAAGTGVRLARRAADAADLAGDAARVAGRHGDDAARAGGALARTADDVAAPALRQGDEMVGTLRGVSHRLPGWEMQPLDYVKRTSEDLAELRGAFNSSGRADFARHIAAENADDLRAAGLNQTQIDRLATGRIPSGYQVHHILPLDDGGTNDFANLVLIRNQPDHQVITNYQNAVTEGMQAGDVRPMQWPMQAERTVVYPATPGGGAVPLN